MPVSDAGKVVDNATSDNATESVDQNASETKTEDEEEEAWSLFGQTSEFV